ncbi:MAG: YafY family transcriptional regulator [Chloroflexi bacterium]|nr:YafY family transcriptional regulator [Chloroflexota bacterium]OJV90743.1 MAG: hypothetical protein BGO39_27320 [Chloroflexi bacterium 54-19]
MYNPTTRLLTILELLQTHPLISGAEISRRLEVEPRTVRRYIMMLQDIGMPIEATHGPGGGYSLRAGFKLPPLMFTEEEATAIILGLVASTWLNAGHDAAAIEGALAKISRVLPVAVRQKLQTVTAHTTILEPTRQPPPDASRLLELSGAIHDSRRISIEYKSFNRAGTRRKVDPYGIGGFQGHWYLIGYCWLRRDYRTFRLDRIENLQVLAETFEKDPTFDYRLFMEGKESEGGFVARILFEDDEQTIRQSIPVIYGKLMETPEGVVMVEKHDNLESMARYLASIHLPFTVLEPPQLREEMQRMGERLLRNARSAPARTTSPVTVS